MQEFIWIYVGWYEGVGFICVLKVRVLTSSKSQAFIFIVCIIYIIYCTYVHMMPGTMVSAGKINREGDKQMNRQ